MVKLKLNNINLNNTICGLNERDEILTGEGHVKGFRAYADSPQFT